MNNLSLSAKKREKTKNSNLLKKNNELPGVIYGFKMDNLNLKVKKNEFIKVYSQAGKSNLVTLKVDGKDYEVIIKDVQNNPVNDDIIHIDFYKIDHKKKIEVIIPLKYIGESKAAKEMGGLLSKNIENVKVKCFPGDLVPEIVVDLKVLDNFDKSIKIKDLNFGEKLECQDNPQSLVVNVLKPKIKKEKEVEEVKKEEVKEEAKKEE